MEIRLRWKKKLYYNQNQITKKSISLSLLPEYKRNFNALNARRAVKHMLLSKLNSAGAIFISWLPRAVARGADLIWCLRDGNAYVAFETFLQVDSLYPMNVSRRYCIGSILVACRLNILFIIYNVIALPIKSFWFSIIFRVSVWIGSLELAITIAKKLKYSNLF